MVCVEMPQDEQHLAYQVSSKSIPDTVACSVLYFRTMRQCLASQLGDYSMACVVLLHDALYSLLYVFQDDEAVSRLTAWGLQHGVWCCYMMPCIHYCMCFRTMRQCLAPQLEDYSMVCVVLLHDALYSLLYVFQDDEAVSRLTA